MAETVTNYLIELSPHMISHPKIYKVSSISGTEISRQEVSFMEAHLVEPELFQYFLVQFKQYVLNFGDSIDPSNGISALNQEALRSFEKGIIYAYNNSRSTEE